MHDKTRFPTILLVAATLCLPLAAALPEPVGPGAPQGLAATAGPGAGGGVTLSWGAASSLLGVTAYNVYHVGDDGNLTLVSQTDGATLGFVEAGLASGQTVTYVVTATDATGEGPASGPTSATTFRAASAPQDVAATPGALGTVGEVTVTWVAPADDGGAPVQGYLVYRDGALVASLGADALQWSDEGQTPLTDHAYAVSAVNVVGEGARSDAACAMASPWGLGLGEPACLGAA